MKTSVTVGVALLIGIGFALPDEPDSASNNIAAKSPSESPVEVSAAPESPEPDPVPVLARVPALAGLDLAQARQELEDAGLTVGTVARQPSAKAAGTVLQQGLEKGAALAPGSVVALVVAAPFPRVPSLVGATKAATISSLKEAGFRVETSIERRTSGKDGVVLRQEPSGGTRAKPNSVVHLVISNIVQPAPAPAPPPEPSNCTPGYKPCLTPATDYDCAGGSGNGPAYTGLVYVTGSDPYDLDSDGDGVACE